MEEKVLITIALLIILIIGIIAYFDESYSPSFTSAAVTTL